MRRPQENPQTGKLPRKREFSAFGGCPAARLYRPPGTEGPYRFQPFASARENSGRGFEAICSKMLILCRKGPCAGAERLLGVLSRRILRLSFCIACTDTKCPWNFIVPGTFPFSGNFCLLSAPALSPISAAEHSSVCGQALRESRRLHTSSAAQLDAPTDTKQCLQKLSIKSASARFRISQASFTALSKSA